MAAQNPGQLDPSFNYLNAKFPSSGGNVTVRNITLLPDGKMLVGGIFGSFHGIEGTGIARLMPDGSVDTSFVSGIPQWEGSVYTTAVQSDGKILIGGMFTQYGGSPKQYLARIHPDGTLDAGFSGAVNGYVNSVVVQSDGKIVVGGDFTQANGVPRNKLARFNSDGTLDETFALGLGMVRQLLLQPDGKIIAVYQSDSNVLVRYHADGSVDPTFNVGTLEGVWRASLQQDGKVLICGTFPSVNGVPKSRIARLNADGSVDMGFTADVADTVADVVSLDDGRIVMCGYFQTVAGQPRSGVCRLLANGDPDPTFATTGFAGYPELVRVQPDGKILIDTVEYNGVRTVGLTRLNTDGSHDFTFGPLTGAESFTSSGFSSWVETLIPLANDNMLVGGSFTHYNGFPARNLARIQPDGAIDAGFMSGLPTTAAGSLASATIQRPDGSIVVAFVVPVNGNYSSRVFRLMPDGSVDPTSTAPTTSIGFFRSLALQADGKILVAGQFSNFGIFGPSSPGIARLNPDGSFDSSFAVGTGATNIQKVAVQPDGKILIGGTFTTFNGTPRKGIARLNENGSLDVTFDPGSGFEGGTTVVVDNIYLEQDGSMWLGGLFTSYDGMPATNLVHVLPNGAYDTSYNAASGPNGFVSKVLKEPSGMYLISGNFTAFNGTPRAGLARIAADGTLDADFVTGSGAVKFGGSTGSIVDIALQSSGAIIAGGQFMRYDGVFRDGIARVFGAECLSPAAPEGSVEQTIPTENPTLADVVVTGTGIRWYASLEDVGTGQTLPISTPLQDGATYYATQTIGGCESEALGVTVELPLGLGDITPRAFRHYPNPVHDVLTVTSEHPVETIAIYSLSGLLVRQFEPRKAFISVPVADLAAGSYLVQLRSDKASEHFIMIKR